MKEKTAGLGNLEGIEIDFDEDLLSEAEAIFNEMAEDYPDWVSSILDELFETHRRCVDDDLNRKAYFERINSIAHDMKGQAELLDMSLSLIFQKVYIISLLRVLDYQIIMLKLLKPTLMLCVSS